VPQGPADEQQPADAAVVSKCEAEDVQIRPGPMSWAGLLKRVFDIGMQNCPNRGACELKVIANIPCRGGQIDPPRS
jgi:hypothetical protein